jgi:hypothetical protein
MKSSGRLALSFSALCLGCFLLPGVLLRLDLHGGSRSGDFAVGALLLGSGLVSVVGTLGFGGATIFAALLAMRDGAKTEARVSLAIVLGVTLFTFKTLRDDQAARAPAEPEPKLEQRCVEAALAGELPPPGCVKP